MKHLWLIQSLPVKNWEKNTYRQEIEIVTLRIELFIELFYYFENSEELEYRSIEEAV